MFFSIKEGIQIRSKKAPVNFSWWPEYYFTGGRDIIILVHGIKIKSCRYIAVSLLSMLKSSKDNNSVAVRRS